jgi:hypothetical protein
MNRPKAKFGKEVMGVFDLFSKRGKPLPDAFCYDFLTKTFRTQIFWAWKKLFTLDAYATIRRILCEEHGQMSLESDNAKPADDFLRFFANEQSRVDVSLDAIELSLTLSRVWLSSQECYNFFHQEALGSYYSRGQDPIGMYLRLVGTVNSRFRENGIGYEYHEESRQLIRTDSLVLHHEAVVPALHLLTDPAYKTAEGEFLKAHEHFRHGEYPDCLTYCCAAIESTIKIICSQKGWSHNPTDAAAALLRVYIGNSNLPSYFEPLLMVIATLRNKLGPHGKGTMPVVVPDYFARYALHATATAVLLLVDHAKTVT